jgi:DNA-binding transcriptional LysR family regulator
MDVASLIPVFVKVIDAGSFTEAAKALRVSRPMVSQYVKTLEAALGVKLIARTTRALATTDAGARFYERCKSIVQDTEAALEELAETHQQVTGRLRVGCPFDLSIDFLPRVLADYGAKFPDVQIELIVEDDIESAISGRLDVTFRVGWLVDSSLHSTKIGSFEPILCASEAFLQRRSPPTRPGQLEELPWVVLTRLRAGDRWTLQTKGRTADVRALRQVRCNSSLTVRELVAAGLGLGVCPDYQIRTALAQRELVRVLPEWRIAGGGVWAVFPHGRTPPLKVRKLIEAASRVWEPKRP